MSDKNSFRSQNLETRMGGVESRFRIISSGSLHDITTPGIYYLTSNVTDKPTPVGGVYIVGKFNDDTYGGVYADVYDDRVYHIRKVGDTWYTNEVTIPEPVTITGTTSSSGAIAIPSEYWSKLFLQGFLTVGTPGFVFRRDGGYFTVFNADMTPKANTNVTISAIFV